MKKTFLMIISSLFLLSLMACGSKQQPAAEKPDGISQEMYELAQNAQDISQQYIDGDITAGAGYQQLKDIHDQSRKILKDTKDDYILDEVISSNIENLMNNVYDDNSSSVVDALDKLNYNMTPIDYDNLKLSDILDGHWEFHHENGGIIDLYFDIDTFAGTLYLPSSNGGYNESKFDTRYYRVDDENLAIIETYKDNSGKKPWVTISNLSPKSFDYVIANSGIKGTAYKMDD